MRTRILFSAVLLLAPACVAVAADTGPAPDVKVIHHLVERYLHAVDNVDLTLLSQIWSHSSETSFIYPLGEEHGYDAIEQHVFRNVMGGMFSMRDLQTQGVTVHVTGKAGWSEFHWTFHATIRKDGSAVTTRGVEPRSTVRKLRSGVWFTFTIPKSGSRSLEIEIPVSFTCRPDLPTLKASRTVVLSGANFQIPDDTGNREQACLP